MSAHLLLFLYRGSTMDLNVKPSQFISWWKFDGKVYLFCSRSGFFSEIDTKTEELIKGVKNIREISDTALAQLLLEKGVLVPAEMDEMGAFRYMAMAEQYTVTPAKLSFTVAVTEKCNYRCRYCFEDGKMSSREMSSETAEKVADYIEHQVKNATHLKEIKITWFGGEPLLMVHTISAISERIIKVCDECNIVFSCAIITNGSLLSPSVIQKLLDCRLSFAQVTLDGDADISCHYKQCSPSYFHSSIEGILLAAEHIRVNVRLNTDGKNIHSILSVVDRIRKLAKGSIAEKNIHYYLACIDSPGQTIVPAWFVEAHKIFINYLIQNSMKQDLIFALPKARYTSCGAVTNSFEFIGVDGKIVKCEHYLGNVSKTVGTVEDGLYHNYEESRFRDDYVNEKCNDCALFPICRQGCLEKRLDEGVSVNCKAFHQNVENILHGIVSVMK